ncbi:MAG: hypothetical protein HY906_14530 [Deltaproteobacteria bacterium]|nr:hypothetical protein [Deltaproteobacteria bacterium]
MAKIPMMVEIQGKCGACGNPLAVNALVPQLLCPSCNQMRPLSPEGWKLLLEDALKEAPQLDVGEGRSTTLLSHGFTIKYGRIDPYCVGCKTDVPEEDLEGLAARGFGFCTKCGARLSFRHAPEGVSPQVPPSAILACEDLDQVAGPEGNLEAKEAAKPVNFPCPSCGASLPVDGSSRGVTCKFCNNDSFLPDALWQRFHPVKTVARWWICYDAADRPFEWDSFRDVVVDGQGNLYCLAEPGSFSDCVPFSLDPQLKLRWLRKDLKLDDESTLALTPTGHLIVGDKRKRSLLVLSCAEGSTVGKVGGTAQPGAPGFLEFEGADAFAVDTDGTIIVLANNCFRRFTPDGREVEPWPGVRPPRAGEDYTDIENLRNQPVHPYTSGMQVSIGWDGYTYLEYCEKVAKLDRQGRVIYETPVQLYSVYGRPRAPTNGWLNVLGRLLSDELKPLGLDEAYALVIVSPDGRQQRRFLLDQGMGGPLGDEDRVAVTPEGFIWLLGDGAKARLIGPDGVSRFVSAKSVEEDAERRQKRQKRQKRPDEW